MMEDTVDYVLDQRSSRLNTRIGKKSSAGENVYLDKGVLICRHVKIGSRVWIRFDARIHLRTTIGDDCIIGCGASVGSYVSIGNTVTIGHGCNIAPGVVIEDDCILEHGAIVGKHAIIRKGSLLKRSATVKAHVEVPPCSIIEAEFL